ncbi:MAG: hypothetical protein DRI90_11080 [Deltaproteobacteria bacterium]|nr:MAG: hypothetical protein DRI90_11080 [Deltaproteobacteria bacterium]
MLSTQANPSGLCTDGQPSSADIWNALDTCVCTTNCASQCANSFCSGGSAQGQCNGCIAQNCSTESTACYSDA